MLFNIRKQTGFWLTAEKGNGNFETYHFKTKLPQDHVALYWTCNNNLSPVSQVNLSAGDSVPNCDNVKWLMKEEVSREGAIGRRLNSSPYRDRICGDRVSCHTCAPIQFTRERKQSEFSSVTIRQTARAD